MEDHNQRKQGNPGTESVEGIAKDNSTHSYGNFEGHDQDAAADNLIADSPKEKIEKQKQYFDDKENPRTHYNVNDQAHSQSSKEDFVKTLSNFKHADGHDDAGNDYPEQVPD